MVVLLQTLAAVEPIAGSAMSRDPFIPVTGQQSADPSNSLDSPAVTALQPTQYTIEAGIAAYEEHLTN